MAGQAGKSAKGEAFLERLATEGRIPGSRGGEKLKSFLEHGDNIREALAADYSVKDVWESLRQSGEVVLSYSLFSQYVRTKLQLRPRHGFEKVEVLGEGEAKSAEPELTEEQKRRNMMVHGNPTGKRA